MLIEMYSATKSRRLVLLHFRKFKRGFNRADIQQQQKKTNPTNPTATHLYNPIMILMVILYFPELNPGMLKSPPAQLGTWYCSKVYARIAHIKNVQF